MTRCERLGSQMAGGDWLGRPEMRRRFRDGLSELRPCGPGPMVSDSVDPDKPEPEGISPIKPGPEDDVDAPLLLLLLFPYPFPILW